MRRSYALGVALLTFPLLAACGDPANIRVVRAGASVEDRERDLQACLDSIPFVALGTYTSDCMANKGWDVISTYKRKGRAQSRLQT